MSAAAPALAQPQHRAGAWALHAGEIVPSASVHLTASTQALNYGTGVFEGIRAYWNAERGQAHVFRMRDHYERLLASARVLKIELGWSVDDLCAITVELLRRNEHRGDTYIRPLAYKLALEPGTSFGVQLQGVSSAFTVTTIPMGTYVPRAGIRCGVSRWRRVPGVCLPARAKITGGYANNALARDDAQAAGFDDAILLDTEGRVAEATTANVFIVRDGELVTPPSTADILPGVTRATILELASLEPGLTVVERAIRPTELYEAAEVFLTGTGVELVSVVEIDRRAVGNGAAGPIANRLYDRYQQIVRNQQPRFSHWLTSFSFD